MKSITSYKNLCNERELCETRIEGLEERRSALIKLVKPPLGVKGVNYSGLPSGKGASYNLENLCTELSEINDKLEVEYAILTNINTTQEKYSIKLKSCKGTAYEIGYMKLIEHKTYREIASELNLTESYVRRIGANILRED